jgi:D-sedoheptulose 7-phosphate isomerase
MKKQPNWKVLLDAIEQANRVYIIGNGGSAANATHIANDLLSCGIKAHSLTADVATLTAIGNDFGYEYVFSRQLDVLGETGDLLIALSGSGNSPNVLNAIKTGVGIGMQVISITGAWQENYASELAHYSIQHGANMQIAEEYQVELVHIIYRNLKGLK